ncbi:hypothetical protein KNP414_04019 [Paenibacillus mucilaginosus KNP414]|uniref:Uncharacterized protein n=1 Tax=Paenibacillus mucilaginosus (strain KNP414) TaxID=1036673 RepID=F8FBI5_PAEMK|nr:hypothetical protein KNP414_04019 [Paenibacillus mucilaginosus KNP414]
MLPIFLCLGRADSGRAPLLFLLMIEDDSPNFNALLPHPPAGAEENFRQRCTLRRIHVTLFLSADRELRERASLAMLPYAFSLLLPFYKPLE